MEEPIQSFFSIKSNEQ